MKNNNDFRLWIAVAIVLLVCSSCRKKVYSPIVGHWGCEQYISCRTDSVGVEHWDTIDYEVKPGCDYELFFYENGTGKLLLNNSPAVVKNFSCTYEYISDSQIVRIQGPEWLSFLYNTFTHGQKEADFDIESLTESSFVASWTNRFSESKPFFEKFCIKRINN